MPDTRIPPSPRPGASISTSDALAAARAQLLSALRRLQEETFVQFIVPRFAPAAEEVNGESGTGDLQPQWITMSHDNGFPTSVSSDFFQGDIDGGLERIRLRLLDLTNRNRLLNYRHTKRSSLRIVDEVPDQLTEMLLDGRELFFKPVLQPRRPSWQWDPQALSDPNLQGPGAGRERPRLPSPREHAEHLGIRTSFDLPSTPESEDARHSDRQIQTLHYPEELESILRSIASSARLAIEETGTNMLYLAAGFLEWYESEDSRQERFAPLLLLPVSIERGQPDRDTHVYRYTIRHSGEDVVANLSLQERMRRDFNIEIPDLGDDEAPESYFRRVEKIVRRFDRWRVRRQMTLTLLSFGKLLMYRDLDPRTWPEGKGPREHARVREFFQGVQGRGGGVAHDYPLDDPKLRARVPPIIDDADSSQHSALLDAVEGKNLVIQGPPGTGKSQTITNLIAAAIAGGRKVLFVSEKLAALEVVRHRLNRAGLGLFCLELHSHKTQKKALIADLKARLEAKGTFSSPRELDDKVESLQRAKERLTRYADLVNEEFGRLGMTVHDILWWCRRSRSRVGGAAESLTTVALPNASTLSRTDVEERRQLIREFAVHLEAVLGANGSVPGHPWAGVTNGSLSFLDQRQVLQRLEIVAEALQHLRAWSDRLKEDTGVAAETARQVRELASAAATLPHSAEGALMDLLPRLRDPAVRRDLDGFTVRLKEYRALRDSLTTRLGSIPGWTVDEAQAISGAAEDSEAALIAFTVDEVARVSAEVDEAADRLRDAASAVAAVLRWLDCSVAVTPGTLPLIEQVLEQLRAYPRDALHRRHGALEMESATATLRNALTAAEPIRDARARLAVEFHLNLAPSHAEVRQHATTAASAGWWSFLDPKYRAAKRAYAVMSVTGKKPSRDELRAAYQSLATYLGQVHAFEADSIWREIAGSHFHGIDTPFEDLLALVEWKAALRRTLQFSGPEGDRLAIALWTGSADRLSALADAADSEKLAGRIHAGVQALEGLPQKIHAGHLPGGEESLREAGDRLKALAEHHHQSSSSIAAAGVPAGFPLDEVPRLVARVQRLRALNTDLASSRDIAAALEAHFAGVETDLERLLATLILYDDIARAPVPEGLRAWLLARDSSARLKDVHRRTAECLELVGRYEAAQERFASLAQLEVRTWYRSDALQEDLLLSAVAERAEVALDAPDKLSTWLDYLRARTGGSRCGLEKVLELAEGGRIAPADVPRAFEFVLSNSIVQEIFRRHPDLAQFSGLSHEEVRRRFAELDRETIELSRRRIAAQLDQRPVPHGNGYGPVRDYTELCLIEREIEKQKRHVPIRQLVRRSGKALQALKPCFMMGPLSVAQYLEPGVHEFDLVVMDEASQMKPEDALGAISRGKQVVVVGDPMQLPPTSFFDRIGDDGDDSDDDPAQALTEAESILDVAATLYRPVRMLRWHYRSRHGSLIAFSNKEFYDQKLVVFPSPVPKSPELGIKLIHVANGVFQNRRNVVEARRLIDAAFRHMRHNAAESLGIVTLNSTQREFVENEIEQRLKTDLHARRFVERHESGLEPLFVKNLENVQGDERDVIFISVTYGPNERGHVYQRFGPINGATGHRRLNVLFTRARKRVALFSSLLAEQIQVQPNSAWGLRALKSYLAYAETGVLEQAQFTGREPDSDFEIEVAEALRSRGYEVAAQVGVAGYFIDLAVKHPSKPDAFALGIECDGATYHSSFSARDRDRLRQAALEDLGWSIARIWSADWFKNPNAEIERIVGVIERIVGHHVTAGRTPDAVGETFSIEEVGRSAVRVAPRLTPEEARKKLTQLRDAEIAPKVPGFRASNCILRDEMIDALLRHRPVDRSEWLDRIPIELRLDTDGRQLSHLDQILEIVGQVR